MRSLLVILLLVPTILIAEECKIVVGGLTPLTGPAASLGERAYQAARLSHENLPDPVRGQITLRFEDTAMQASKAAPALQSLLTVPNLNVLITTYAETAAVAAPVVEREKIPGFLITPDRRPLEGKHYSFFHWVGGEEMGPVLAAELQRRGLKRIALIYSENPSQLSFERSFKPLLPDFGIELIHSVNVLPTETDLRSYLTSALRKQPDAIVYFMLPPQPSAFAKQLRQLNPRIPIFAFVNTESSSEVAAAKGDLEGTIYAGPKYSSTFVHDFQSKYGHYPEGTSANVYDAIQMIGAALESGACSRAEIHSFIRSLKQFSGVFGRYGINDRNEFVLPVGLKQIKNGTFQPLKD